MPMLIKGSKAERLFRLFDTPGRHDGMHRLAAELTVSHVVLWRWGAPRNRQRGHGGPVPIEYNLRILEAGDKLGVSRDAIAEFLELNVCPTCKRPMPAGRVF